MVLTLCNERYFFLQAELFLCLRSCFLVGEFYLREVLSHHSGGVASFYQAIFEIFGYFSQKWFERNRSLEAGALLL